MTRGPTSPESKGRRPRQRRGCWTTPRLPPAIQLPPVEKSGWVPHANEEAPPWNVQGGASGFCPRDQHNGGRGGVVTPRPCPYAVSAAIFLANSASRSAYLSV